MKASKLALATIVAATPALAHSDGSFHTHGSETFLVLAGMAVIALVVFRSKG